MTQCDLWRDNLKAYADGELPFRTRLAVRLHLLRCGECRREINEMTDLSNSLKANDAGTLDDALRTRILNAVPDAAPDVPQNLPPIRSQFPRRRIPLYAFGMSAMALVGGFLLYPFLPSTQEKARQMAALSNRKQEGLALSPYAQDYDSQGNAVQSARLTAPSKSYASSAGLPDLAAPAGAAKSSGAAAGGMASKPAVAPNPTASRRDPYYDKKKEIAEAEGQYAPARAKFAPPVPVDGERKTHREASLTLEVDKTEARSETVSNMTKTVGGYIANDSLQTEGNGTKIASLTLKIPVAQFGSFLTKLARLGDLKAKSVSGEDITEKTRDQEQATRIVSGDVKELETKVQKERHTSRRDEEALRQLRSREAQAQAHLKRLHKLGALADITVKLREKPKPEPVKP